MYLELVEIEDRAVRVEPEQIAGMEENNGTVLALFTVIVIMVEVAHCVPPGVNV
jgi:hypothetical protein